MNVRISSMENNQKAMSVCRHTRRKGFDFVLVFAWFFVLFFLTGCEKKKCLKMKPKLHKHTEAFPNHTHKPKFLGELCFKYALEFFYVKDRDSRGCDFPTTTIRCVLRTCPQQTHDNVWMLCLHVHGDHHSCRRAKS